nr:RNA-directed DNA polymerase, eukaryota, reverse transcriptase zinc-binding domain protein [Tanacetum cinerariifolium]
MFYADDAIFMGQWSKRNIDTLMYMLKCFERASSLSINFSKNMDGWKPKVLKNKSFAEIQELFDKAMKRINTFVDFRTKLVEESSKKVEAKITQKESSKRARDELEQETAKKKKIVDDKELANLKQLVKIIPEEDIAIDAMPLAVNTIIVDWKIYKEGNKSYYQI